MTSLWRGALFPLVALVLGLTHKTLHSSAATNQGAMQTHGFPIVAWRDAGPRVSAGEWLLVDAREEPHYQAQHIPGAISLPVNSYPEMLTFFAEDHGTEKTVVVYCATEECDLSSELAARLRDEAGCRDVRILEGGLLGWRRSAP